MDIQSNNFIPLSQVALSNAGQRAAVAHATMGFAKKRDQAMFAVSPEHGEALRRQAAEVKRRALRKLPDLLEQAEANMQAKGIQVLWAADGAEAVQQILEIAARHQVQRVVKSKSMATEEIGLNHALEAARLEVIETDLGEFIVQLSHDSPSHIIAPVIHKSKASIQELFIRELNMPPIEDAREMTRFVREHLRQAFLSADMGVTGGNFLIAETGSLALVMNEGNGRMVTTMPRVHVAVIGLEKVVETVEDYALLVQMIARSGTGQKLSVYSHIVNAPAPPGTERGAEHVYVILLDNGRSDIYADEKYTEVLACIRCGACLNACPVYRSTGGHAYGWVYSGPIGAVVTPLLNGIENAKPLPYASSLCGRCKQVCPVDIDLPRMLLELRHDLVAAGKGEKLWAAGIKAWAAVNQSPRLFELGGRAARLGAKSKLDTVVPSPLGDWRKYRDFPDFAPKSFRQLWRERKHEQS